MLVGVHVSNPAAEPVSKVALADHGPQAPPYPLFRNVLPSCRTDSRLEAHKRLPMSTDLVPNLPHPHPQESLRYRGHGSRWVGILAGLEQQAAGTGSDLPPHLTSFMDKDPDQVNTSILNLIVGVSRERVDLDHLPRSYTADACEKVLVSPDQP